jgi:hypothetical protein
VRDGFFFGFMLYLVAQIVAVWEGLGGARCDAFCRKLFARCEAFSKLRTVLFFGFMLDDPVVYFVAVGGGWFARCNGLCDWT